MAVVLPAREAAPLRDALRGLNCLLQRREWARGPALSGAGPFRCFDGSVPNSPFFYPQITDSSEAVGEHLTALSD